MHSTWKVSPGDWKSEALIRFTFDYESQDIDKFLKERINTVENGEATYTVEDLLVEGCFIERPRIETMIARLKIKQNLILQGPPGTGKTWLAKHLAFVLIGQQDSSDVRAVQFHPNFSYEDFVRGWRPAGNGRLDLVDGPFLELVKDAQEHPHTKMVLVIEEINRDNPAQMFGEILTLLEADKRNLREVLQLSYRRNHNERVYVPDNLYIIGTMNVADRLLALVDFALRRRFAFVDLEPSLGDAWLDWASDHGGMNREVLEEIRDRLLDLNKTIAADAALGRQFQVGHSFVTPPAGERVLDARTWFRQILETEIGPLLKEYWFDELDKAETARTRLLKEF